MASTAFVGVDLGAGGAPRAPAHVVEPFLGARDASDGSNGGVAALGGGSAAREAALLVELELARLGDSAAGVRDAFNGYRDARDAEGGEVASLARARAAALAEARDALGRKTATILEAVRRKCKDHRRDRDRILAESAASVAAATREALAEHDKFDGLQALALGAIESAQARAEASCQALRNENAALREELQSVVRRGVSDLANSGSRSDLACAAAAGPFRKPGQVTSSESSRGGGSGSDSDPRAAGSSEAETSDPSDDGASNSAGSGGDICKGVVEAVVAAAADGAGRDDDVAARLLAAEERERHLLHYIMELRAALLERQAPPPPPPSALMTTLPPRAPRPRPDVVDGDVEDDRDHVDDSDDLTAPSS